MAQNITGVNNVTSTTGTKNDIEDYGTALRSFYRQEGIIDGLDLSASSPNSNNVAIKKGLCAIDCSDAGFLVFRLKDDIASLSVPNTGSAKYYLVVLKVDLTNATAEFEVIEGTPGTDPTLTEGGAPEVYYLEIGRIEHTGASSSITEDEILQDGTTLTNNGDYNVIGRYLTNTGWEKSSETFTRVSDTQLTVKGDRTGKFDINNLLQIRSTNTGVLSSPAFVRIYSSEYDSTTNLTTITIYGSNLDIIPSGTITEVWVSKNDQPMLSKLLPKGWYPLDATLTRIGTDSPTYTLQITGEDWTSELTRGMYLWFQQNGADVYGIVTEVELSGSDTVITMYGGTDYIVEVTSTYPITSVFIALPKQPGIGFPLDPEKWSERIILNKIVEQTSPADGTWYNLDSIELVVPIGAWELGLCTQVLTFPVSAPATLKVHSALSTSLSAISDKQLSESTEIGNADWISALHKREKIIDHIATKQSYYLIVRTNIGGSGSLYLDNADFESGYVVAKSIYI
jgi:hypothetical protein